MGTINNASNQPIFAKAGTVPDVSGALQDYYQNMIFTKVTKQTSGFQVQELGLPINFRGLIQPYGDRKLLLLPEGQRAWTWFTLHSDPVLTLQVDDVVIWNGKQTRIMSRKDNFLYGFIEYSIVQDWLGSGP